MKIRVKTLDGDSKELELPDDASLRLLHQLIEEKMGIVKSRQRIIFQGKPLTAEDDSLYGSGVRDGLTLHMVERPPPIHLASNSEARTVSDSSTRERDAPSSERVVIINGEMTIVRNAIFQNAETTTAIVRDATATAISMLAENVSFELMTQENVPNTGDLSVRVHIRANPTRFVNSEARNRILNIREALCRIRRTLNILEREPFTYVTVEGNEHFIPQLITDAERARFGENILELEEILHLPRSDMIGPLQSDVDAHNITASPEVSNLQASNSSHPHPTLRSVFPNEHIELLDDVIAMQNLTVNHLRQYQHLVNNRVNMLDHSVRFIATCYEENLRRVLHRLSHIYHSLSDMSVDFVNASAPVEPNACVRSENPITEVVLRLLFRTPANRPTLVAAGAANTNPPQNIRHIHVPNVVSQTLRFANPPSHGISGGIRNFPPSRFPARGPLPIQENMVSSIRMPFTTRIARLHVAPNDLRNDSSSMFTVPIEQHTGPGRNSAGITNVTVNVQAEGDNALDRGGLQNIFRNILQGAIGNMMPMHSGNQATTTGSTQPSQQSQGNQQTSQIPTTQPSMPPIRTALGPGIVGQIFVRANGSANAEATRSAVDAAVMAATAAANSQGVQVQVSNGSNSAPNSHRHSGNVVWARRTYVNRDAVDESVAEDMFIGPRFPTETPIYTNDRYLMCQSRLSNPRPAIHNSDHYEALIYNLYQATQRCNENSKGTSSQRGQQNMASLLSRWDKVRGADPDDAHAMLNQRGEVIFDRAEHFKNVLMAMLRRAVANLSDADAEIAAGLNTLQGEYDSANYGMIPMFNNAPNGLDIGMPIVGSLQIDAVEEEEGTDEPNNVQASNLDESVGNDRNSGRSDATQDSSTTGNQGTEQGNESTDVDILDLVRILSQSMQSGRPTTLAQVMREVGQPISHSNSGSGGFVNLILVMGYELLQVPEIVQLLNGDFSALSRNRQQMRRYLIDNVLNDNCHPDEEDIGNAANRVAISVSELERFLEFDHVHRFAIVDGIGCVDLLASVINVDRRTAGEFLRFILEQNDTMSSEQFSTALVKIFTSYVYRVVVLANLSMNGNPYDYETFLFRFMEQTPRGAEHFLGVMSHASLGHIRTLLQRECPFTVFHMEEDLILTASNSSAVEEQATPRFSVGADGSLNVSSRVDIVDQNLGSEVNSSMDVGTEGNAQASNVENHRTVLPQEWVPVIENDVMHNIGEISEQLSEAYRFACFDKKKKKKQKDTINELQKNSQSPGSETSGKRASNVLIKKAESDCTNPRRNKMKNDRIKQRLFIKRDTDLSIHSQEEKSDDEGGSHV